MTDPNVPGGNPDENRSEYMVRLAVELRQLGVSETVTRYLLLNYPLESIDRQLLYLPYRNAKRRSSLIVASIKDDYGAPANMPEDVEANYE